VHIFLNGRLKVKTGDITAEQVDAIVNAANSTLLGGGGVDGAIHRAGGPRIIEECKQLRKTRFPDGLPTGEAVITSGGDLAAPYVIHTVGPVYGNNSNMDAELLARCYRNSIRVALETNLNTIAFPAISTGVYGYPKKEAALVAAKTIRDELAAVDRQLEVRLVFFTEADAAVFISSSGL